MKNVKTILGIDPGYDRCGWAVVRGTGSDAQVIAADCFQTPKQKEKLERFSMLWDFMDTLCMEHQIDALAIETLFFSRNVSTALPVSEVRGLLFATAFTHKLPIFEYTPQQVKLAVTGYGRADKSQVTQMVKRLLKLEKIPKIDDTGDALAVALTHLAHQRAL
jgi:crossover junction endodeoxyribonuclease RuvC